MSNPSFLDFGAGLSAPSANPWAASFPATHNPPTPEEQRAVAWNLGYSPDEIGAMSPAALAAIAGAPAVSAGRFVPPAEDLADALRAAGDAAGRAASSITGGLISAAPWMLPAVGLALGVFFVSKLK